MIVTIDTNIFVQDFWFENLQSRVFFEGHSLLPVSLYIPELVIDETVNKYKEKLTEKVKEYENINRDLNNLRKANQNYEIIDIPEETQKYQQFLTEKLKELNANIIPYPIISHKEIVSKILKRQKPFKKGDSGYRDFLIWECVRNLEHWGIEEIVFITNNTNDFGEGPFISEELKGKRTENKNIQLFTSLSKFNETYIISRLNKLKELKATLTQGKVENFDFKKWLDENIIYILNNIGLEEIIVGFPHGVGNVTVSEITLFNDFSIEELQELDSGNKLLKFIVSIKVEASIDINPDDYYNHIEVRDYFKENTDEFVYASAMTTEDIEVKGYLILDKNKFDIISYEITSMNGPYGSIDIE